VRKLPNAKPSAFPNVLKTGSFMTSPPCHIVHASLKGLRQTLSDVCQGAMPWPQLARSVSRSQPVIKP
ncbi:MAG: hypothetical protein ACK6A4_13905, partial [Alphaproteobacteria bacterium]